MVRRVSAAVMLLCLFRTLGDKGELEKDFWQEDIRSVLGSPQPESRFWQER